MIRSGLQAIAARSSDDFSITVLTLVSLAKKLSYNTLQGSNELDFFGQ
jgi:hypothetical protein